MTARYEIRDLIAQSGGGKVYHGWDHEQHREVVIKRAGSDGDDAALRQEAAVLAQVRHPNITALLDIGDDESGTFIVMERVPGRTLESVVAQCPLDSSAFDQLAAQTLDGLIAAHAQNVVHQDLSPQNIMVEVGAAGRVRATMLDFGASRTLPADGAMSETGPVMGSLFFMAPERFDRVPADARSDLYSLGCVCYFALAGTPPFQGDTAPQVMVSHLRHQFTPLAAVRPDLPAFIPKWVEWLISRNPDDRPANAAVALDAYRARRFPA